VEGLEDEAASLVEDALAVFNVADNFDPSDLAARYAGVAGVLCDAQSALDASGLRARDVAGDALDFGVIEAIDHNLVAGPEQPELCIDGAGGAAPDIGAMTLPLPLLSCFPVAALRARLGSGPENKARG